MRLLFDQDLSRRLVDLLADEFPGSAHVTEHGRDTATDDAMWRYARDHGFVAASKDSAFPTGSPGLHRPGFIAGRSDARQRGAGSERPRAFTGPASLRAPGLRRATHEPGRLRAFTGPASLRDGSAPGAIPGGLRLRAFTGPASLRRRHLRSLSRGAERSPGLHRPGFIAGWVRSGSDTRRTSSPGLHRPGLIAGCAPTQSGSCAPWVSGPSPGWLHSGVVVSGK